MKRNYFRRRINKTLKKLAKINLSHLFNSNNLKSIGSINGESPNAAYREKIKTEYHYAPRRIGVFEQDSNVTCAFSDNDRYNSDQNRTFSTQIHTENSINSTAKCIELSFNYMEPPTLRDQIEIISAQVHFKRKTIYETNGNDIDSPIYEPLDSGSVLSMSAGRYLHIGIMDGIKKTVRFTFPGQMVHLTVGMYVMKAQVSADGPINPLRYFAIFGRITDCHDSRIPDTDRSFVIGVYEGRFPVPTIANEFLQPFINEMKEVIGEKLIVVHGVEGKVNLHGIVADPIANSLMTCTALPNGLYGCSKCKQKGQLQFNRSLTSFPPVCKTELMRLDEDFQYCLDKNYHLGVPNLLQLDVRLVSQVAIDYRNTILLGVMRRLVSLWTEGRLDHRINKEALRKIDNDLLAMNCPREFKQQPKKLSDHATWDSYDWKQFLLYYGPIVLREYLPIKFYLNFLYLHLGVRVMINPEDHNKFSAFVSGLLLKRFLLEFSMCYGQDQIDYNIHNLLHFEDTITRYGSLEGVSGFPFIHQIDFLQQSISLQDNTDILMKIAEKMLNEPYRPKELRITSNRSYQIDSNFNLHFRGFVVNNRHPNDYVITSKGPAKIRGIFLDSNNKITVLAQPFRNCEVLYNAPITNQKVFLATDFDDIEKIDLSDVILKAISFKTARGICVMPMMISCDQ